ncbi:hypothetical protein ACH5RR_003079 [Cinchona calisaya]|uniref:Uncharacterized protein n=1 Tax=Cinchona calisaya TaxID=153742 RepID=A0ABD3AU65_9GENT
MQLRLLRVGGRKIVIEWKESSQPITGRLNEKASVSTTSTPAAAAAPPPPPPPPPSFSPPYYSQNPSRISTARLNQLSHNPSTLLRWHPSSHSSALEGPRFSEPHEVKSRGGLTAPPPPPPTIVVKPSRCNM